MNLTFPNKLEGPVGVEAKHFWDLFQLNPNKMRVKVITQLLYSHTQLIKITFVHARLVREIPSTYFFIFDNIEWRGVISLR